MSLLCNLSNWKWPHTCSWISSKLFFSGNLILVSQNRVLNEIHTLIVWAASSDQKRNLQIFESEGLMEQLVCQLTLIVAQMNELWSSAAFLGSVNKMIFMRMKIFYLICHFLEEGNLDSSQNTHRPFSVSITILLSAMPQTQLSSLQPVLKLLAAEHALVH